jgi:hypothetical protein
MRTRDYTDLLINNPWHHLALLILFLTPDLVTK